MDTVTNSEGLPDESSSNPFTVEVIVSIAVSVVIVLLVVATVVALCWYCNVKKRRAKRQRTGTKQVVFQNGNSQSNKRPITSQIVQVLRGKKKKTKTNDAGLQPAAPAVSHALDHAQVDVQNHLKEGGTYDVSINGIAQEAFVSPPPLPAVTIIEPTPLPAPHPTPKPEPGTTIFSVHDVRQPAAASAQPVVQYVPVPEPAVVTTTTSYELSGPTVYTVPVAPTASHGYAVQTASFAIPNPTPAPILHAAPPQLSLPYQPAPAPLPAPAFLPSPPTYPAAIGYPPAAGMATAYAPQPMAQQYAPQAIMPASSAVFAPPSGLYSAPAFQQQQQSSPDTVTYGGDKSYAVTLPNISLQTTGRPW